MISVKGIFAPLLFAFSLALQADVIHDWACWGPGWGRGGLAAAGPGYEGHLAPQPGDMDLSLGTDRLRLLPWIEVKNGDGLIDFLSSDFPSANILDADGRWAGGASYASTYIHARQAECLALNLQTTKDACVWLNGTQVKRQMNSFTLDLREGWNRLLIKSLSPSAIRGSKGGEKEMFPPSGGKPGNWTLRGELLRLDGSAPQNIELSVYEPGRSELKACLGLLSKLSDAEGNSPFFSQNDWNGTLRLRIEARSGASKDYQADPTLRYKPKEHWIYTRRPTSAAEVLTPEALKVALPAALMVEIVDYADKTVFSKRLPLDFDGKTVAEQFIALDGGLRAKPGHYSLLMTYLDKDGKMLCHDNQHAFAVTMGAVPLRSDAPRKISCVGHWMAHTEDIEIVRARLKWLNTAGITWHQKLTPRWEKWGISHDGEGNVKFTPNPIIEQAIEIASKLNITIIGDLTPGYVDSEKDHSGRLEALTAEESESGKALGSAGECQRLIDPHRRNPTPIIGSPEFKKTIHTYVKTLVSYYKGRIKYWGGDNEIDLHAGRGGESEAKAYCGTMKITYAAMKEANPDAIFISPSIGRDTAFTRSFFSNGFASACDWVDVHAHPFESPSPGDSTIGNCPTEGLGVAESYCANPVIYGEVSAPLAHSPDGAIGQAKAVPLQVAWALRRDRIRLFSYLVPYYNGANLGFCNIYGDPLPAACSVNAVSNLLDGRLRLPDLELPSGVMQVRVKDGDSDIILLWSKKALSFKLPLPGGFCEIYDVLGNVKTGTPKDGTLVLELSPTPIYVKRLNSLSIP